MMASEQNEHVIIVAGGQGIRMGGEIPKQFLPLKGLPVLMHTINQFVKYSRKISVILVLPSLQIDYWMELCNQYNFGVPHTVIAGGDTRFHSVLNGLTTIHDVGYTAVHDGVRPFVSVKTIADCFEMARKQEAAIPVVEPVESLRRMDGDDSYACLRDQFRLVQTPQVFQTKLLKAAYEQPWQPAFTDDAAVVEAAGHKITLVPGNRENIKITSPFDMVVGEAWLNSIFR
jgi:2-C-methyl-D-erythritol 4-phosphate cytidylyltransferase